MDAVQMARRGGRKRGQRRVNRKSYASFAVTEPPDITTMRLRVKDVKVSSFENHALFINSTEFHCKCTSEIA